MFSCGEAGEATTKFLMIDPYKVLSVSKYATLNDIKVAYRRLAFQLHPDTNGGDKVKSEKFKAVSEAYNILSNDYQRRQYDMQSEASKYTSPHANYGTSYKSNRYGYVDPSHFDVRKWNAYHYGDGEEVIIDVGPEAYHNSKPPKGKKKGKQQFKREVYQEFADDDIDDFLKHMNIKKGKSPRRKKSGNVEECRIS
jgi:curved DNA-binding protein CbpA